MDKFIYFAYGSNMNSERLRKRTPSAVEIGRAKLLNKDLVFNKKSTDGSMKANIINYTGKSVWGVLFEIDTDEMEQLEKAEEGYDRVYLDVYTDKNEKIKAYVYISSDVIENERPYDWYKEFILEGAREHKLPIEYIEHLEEITSKPDRRKGI